MSMETSVHDQQGQSSQTIIDVKNLQTTFFTDKETIRAVDGISFTIDSGETVGIVGESGSGKSVTARSLMGLVESPGKVRSGSSIQFHHPQTVSEYAEKFPKHTVRIDDLEAKYSSDDLFYRDDFDGTPQELGYDDPAAVPLADLVAAYGRELDLIDEHDCVFITDDNENTDTGPSGFIEITHLGGEAQRLMRGGKIAMVFQDPLTSLNPVYTVGNQINEALRLHRGLSGAEATKEATKLLEDVGIPDARRRVNEYPHQFSGGMRQRAVIAMALACDPEVLICDEPTTALDVTIQAQILDLLNDLQKERDVGIMFITHDMGVIAEVSDRVNVMYAGEIVESATVESIFANPRHPYTDGLLQSIPGRQSGERLSTIDGNVTTPNEEATYCRFADRCPKAFAECETVHPVPVQVNDDTETHSAACLLYPEQLSEQRAVAYHRDRNKRSNEEEHQ